MINLLFTFLHFAAANNPFGTIEKPPGVENFSSGAGAAPDEIGLLIFFSRMISLATIIAGLYVLFNFIMAGYLYINSSGDSSAHQKVKDNITNSVIGLIIIAMAYTLVAVLGLLFFGKADYFLNPTLPTP